ncbi:MAG TPA: DUF4224 domain-containing protein [Candidatus Saccharimonadia bacterium]|nr:DUF4224 domain-containing protein [Candidatus Saccharimonadia bacterium]
MILSAQELIDLTLKERPSAQRRELEFLGIASKPRKDGSLIVLWEDVRGTQNNSKPREPQLRLDA